MPKRIDLTNADCEGSCYPAPTINPARDDCGASETPAGLTQFGVNLNRLPPVRTWSSRRHWHTGEDEFIFVACKGRSGCRDRRCRRGDAAGRDCALQGWRPGRTSPSEYPLERRGARAGGRFTPTGQGRGVLSRQRLAPLRGGRDMRTGMGDRTRRRRSRAIARRRASSLIPSAPRKPEGAQRHRALPFSCHRRPG